MTDKNIPLLNRETDEALWSAYRREDKAAVMDYLFRRSLVGISRSTSFAHLLIKTDSKSVLATERAHCEPMQSMAERVRLRDARYRQVRPANISPPEASVSEPGCRSKKVATT